MKAGLNLAVRPECEIRSSLDRMDDALNENAMLMAANVARNRRADDVRRRSKHHADVIDNSTQTVGQSKNELGQKTESRLTRDWFLWKQTTLLCSLTFTMVLGTITQLKQMITVGSAHNNYSLLLCTMLCSLSLQCFVVLLLLFLTNNEGDWLQDIHGGTSMMQKTINVIMAAVAVISFLEICEFLLID